MYAKGYHFFSLLSCHVHTTGRRCQWSSSPRLVCTRCADTTRSLRGGGTPKVTTPWVSQQYQSVWCSLDHPKSKAGHCFCIPVIFFVCLVGSSCRSRSYAQHDPHPGEVQFLSDARKEKRCTPPHQCLIPFAILFNVHFNSVKQIQNQNIPVKRTRNQELELKSSPNSVTSSLNELEKAQLCKIVSPRFPRHEM